jgi:hypothetical protein
VARPLNGCMLNADSTLRSCTPPATRGRGFRGQWLGPDNRIGPEGSQGVATGRQWAVRAGPASGFQTVAFGQCLLPGERRNLQEDPGVVHKRQAPAQLSDP